MPELTFVLPHWLYWLGLVGFPLAAYFIFRNSAGLEADEQNPVSNKLAYFFLIAGGFVGCHRLYLKSPLVVVYVALFVSVLVVNAESRGLRDVASEAKNQVDMLESRIARAERNVRKAEERLQRKDDERNRDRLDKERKSLEEAKSRVEAVAAENRATQAQYADWQGYSSLLGVAILLLMLFDATRIPKLVRERNDIERGEKHEIFVCPTADDSYDISQEKFAFGRVVSRLNGFCGELVAYWSAIAVFVYYYEVVSRYVFNSPTNWAHEAMFLMFGMQYLIAGGFVLREGGHVRVDVLYTNLSIRTRAILDLATSVFFFIFVTTLLVTGWIFFSDALNAREVSFTEWGIQYYPIKLALPAGAVLLMLQGIAQLMNDIDKVRYPHRYDDVRGGIQHGA